MPLIKDNIESYRSIAKLLSVPSIKQCLQMNDLKLMYPKLKKHCNLPEKSISYKNIIKKIYFDLYTNYRNEYVFKNELINQLIIEKFKLKSTVILSEFKIAESIADLVMLNGSIRIFEIKTDLDTLDKLNKQLLDYQKFAEEISVVTTSKYKDVLSKSFKKLPFGIIEFTEEGTFKVIKKATKFCNSLEHLAIFKTLRKNEYLNIIANYYGFIPNVPNTLMFKECFKLISLIEVSEFQKLALLELKKRNVYCSNLIGNKQPLSELNHVLLNINANEHDLNKLNTLLQKTIC